MHEVGSGKSRALVIGGSMAGLLAARVLAGHFDKVTLIEKDSLPEGVYDRKGVPQGRHAHALLSGGREVVERLFPGFTRDLLTRGATSSDVAMNGRWYQPGGYRCKFVSGIRGLSGSRPLLEGYVRQRVREITNVTLVDECTVTGLEYGDGRVTGAIVRRGRHGGENRLDAELVLDCSGRGSRAAVWMKDMGYETPDVEEITIKISYTTRIYRRNPEALPGATFSVIQFVPPDMKRSGTLLSLEGDRWMVTLGGILGEHAPADEEGFLEFARSLAAPDIYDAIKDAVPVGDARTHKFPSNLRRRYERLQDVPEGYVVMGDAFCSFNPVYGQGMSVAALEAAALDESLEDGVQGLPKRFYEKAAGAIDIPWQLAAGADLAFPEVTGRRTRVGAIVGKYVSSLMRAATSDEKVCLALVKVTNLMEPPAILFRPGIVVRVALSSIRKGRSASRTPVPRKVPEVV